MLEDLRLETAGNAMSTRILKCGWTWTKSGRGVHLLLPEELKINSNVAKVTCIKLSPSHQAVTRKALGGPDVCVKKVA